MKVRITKASMDSYWYTGNIGKVFEVDGTVEDGDYKVTGKGKWICEVDCEVIKEFTAGQRVKLLNTKELMPRYKGENEATYIKPYSYSSAIIRLSNGDTQAISNEFLAAMPDEQWMDKATALKLCIDGAKIVPMQAKHPMTHMYFDGKDFMYYYGIQDRTEKATYHLECIRWKLWQPPTPPQPKFTVADFVQDDDGDYGRIVSMEYKGNTWMYKLSDCVDNDDLWTKAEGDIEVA